jgi:hypothetical protein
MICENCNGNHDGSCGSGRFCSRRCARSFSGKAVCTPARGRKLRKDQLLKETSMAKTLEQEGFTVFSPTVVCDRIAIKGRKVFFVEFKKPGQKLRPGQQAVQTLIPKRYIIRYG